MGNVSKNLGDEILVEPKAAFWHFQILNNCRITLTQNMSLVVRGSDGALMLLVLLVMLHILRIAHASVVSTLGSPWILVCNVYGSASMCDDITIALKLVDHSDDSVSLCLCQSGNTMRETRFSPLPDTISCPSYPHDMYRQNKSTHMSQHSSAFLPVEEEPKDACPMNGSQGYVMLFNNA